MKRLIGILFVFFSFVLFAVGLKKLKSYCDMSQSSLYYFLNDSVFPDLEFIFAVYFIFIGFFLIKRNFKILNVTANLSVFFAIYYITNILTEYLYYGGFSISIRIFYSISILILVLSFFVILRKEYFTDVISFFVKYMVISGLVLGCLKTYMTIGEYLC